MVHAFRKPRSERRSVPARHLLVGVEGDMRTVRRVPLKLDLHRLSSDFCVDGWRNAHRETLNGGWSENIAGIRHPWHAVGTDVREHRTPCAVQQELDGIGAHWPRSVDPRKPGVDAVAENRRRRLNFDEAVWRNVGMQRLEFHFSRERVVDAIEKLAHDAEALGHDAACIAGVHTFGQNIDREVATDNAAQRIGHPELVVVATTRIETDDEIRSADHVGERLDVIRKIGASRLLTRLDDDDDAGMRDVLLDEETKCGNCGEGRVTVVRTTTTVETVTVEYCLPRR